MNGWGVGLCGVREMVTLWVRMPGCRRLVPVYNEDQPEGTKGRWMVGRCGRWYHCRRCVKYRPLGCGWMKVGEALSLGVAAGFVEGW